MTEITTKRGAPNRDASGRSDNICPRWAAEQQCYFGSMCFLKHDPSPLSYVIPDPTISPPCPAKNVCTRPGCYYKHRSPTDPTLPEYDPAGVRQFVVSLGEKKRDIEAYFSELLGDVSMPPSVAGLAPDADVPLSDEPRPLFRSSGGAFPLSEDDIGLPQDIFSGIPLLETTPDAPFIAIEDKFCETFDKAFRLRSDGDGGYVVTYATALAAHTFPMRNGNPVYKWAQDVPRAFHLMPHEKYRPLCFKITNTVCFTMTEAKPAVLVELTLRPSETDARLTIAGTRVYAAQIQVGAFVSFEEASAAIGDLALRAPQGTPQRQPTVASPHKQALRDAFEVARRLTLCSDPRLWHATIRTRATLTATLDIALDYSDPTQPGEFVMRQLQATADQVMFDFARSSLPEALSARLLCQVTTMADDDMDFIDEYLCWEGVDPAARSFKLYDEAIQRLTHGYFSAGRVMKSIAHEHVIQLLSDTAVGDPRNHVVAVFSAPLRQFDSLYNQGLLMTALMGEAVCPPPDAPADPKALLELYAAHSRVQGAARSFLLRNRLFVSAKVFNSKRHGNRTPCLTLAGVVMPNRSILLVEGLGEAQIPEVEADESKFPAGSTVTVVVPLGPEDGNSSFRLLNPRVDLPEETCARFLAQDPS